VVDRCGTVSRNQAIAPINTIVSAFSSAYYLENVID